MDLSTVQKVVEAALLISDQPLAVQDLSRVLGQSVAVADIRRALGALQVAWMDRGLVLAEVAGGWRFQTRDWLSPFLSRLHEEKTPKYSRAVMETLAIVAYRQPVTRGDIEDIRGVAVSPSVVKQLEDRGWIGVIGFRETVGRPALFATTPQFLNDFGLANLSALPVLDGVPMPHSVTDMFSAAQVQAVDDVPPAATTVQAN